jgi:branched-chain amino acid transport system permease protein
MTTAVNIIVSALILAAVYGLVGSGFIVLYRTTGVLNFAQGAFMVIGAEVFYTLTQRGALGLIPALLVSILALMGSGTAAYWLVFSRVRGLNHLTLTIGTIGLGIMLLMISNMIWGSKVRTLHQTVSHRRIVLFNLVSITPADIAILAIGIIGVGSLIAIVRYTRTGVRMRATADSQLLAQYTGAEPGRMSALAWGLAGATAAAAGVAYSLHGQLAPTTVYNLGLAVFPAIILGGIDSFAGVVLGALIVGLVESTVGIFLGGQWEAPVAYVLLVCVIVARPRGLLGSPHVARI